MIVWLADRLVDQLPVGKPLVRFPFGDQRCGEASDQSGTVEEHVE